MLILLIFKSTTLSRNPVLVMFKIIQTIVKNSSQRAQGEDPIDLSIFLILCRYLVKVQTQKKRKGVWVNLLTAGSKCQFDI